VAGERLLERREVRLAGGGLIVKGSLLGSVSGAKRGDPAGVLKISLSASVSVEKRLDILVSGRLFGIGDG
jgi:hypothetical protein